MPAIRWASLPGLPSGPEIDGLPDSCKVEYPGTAQVLQGIYDKEVDCGVCDQGVKEYLTAGLPVLYPIPALTYKRPLYVMFNQEKQRMILTRRDRARRKDMIFDGHGDIWTDVTCRRIEHQEHDVSAAVI